MEKIILPAFGTITTLTAAEVVAPNGDVYAYVPEPEQRGEAAFDEQAFRVAIRQAVSGWDMPGVTLSIQYDPGRNHATEEAITL